MDMPVKTYHSTIPKRCDLQFTSIRDRRLPVISAVCREAREVVLGIAACVTGEHTNAASVHYPNWDAHNCNMDLRIRPRIDIVHLHCASDGSNLAFGFPGGSMLTGYLMTFGRLKHCYVVLNIIELHMARSNAAHSGVFGTLGEETIKLVDLKDLYTLSKFRDAGVSYGPGALQDPESLQFFSDTLDAA
ncbi:Uu.00g067700.m01.CDS01 [Anthostomella pinea]|uniref:Uu.00g067700.m01.CDS01 n=1 Tax=Anthostomella pinea TaxID=933095 RepID=A0AAI8VV16_9PEZI|nr:Uu.00g067700.m01.CDS01 [Anthostomella pinea]